jgi:hypothetical protein
MLRFFLALIKHLLFSTGELKRQPQSDAWLPPLALNIQHGSI